MESGMTEKRMMEKASFAEICRMMRDRKGEAVECMKGVFEVALLFLPGFMCKEAAFITNVANGVSLLGAKAAVGKSIDHFIRVFGKGDYTDFTSKYEHAQAAQVLMVFAAYFDSMRLYLPDGEGWIEVTPGEKLALAEQAVKRVMWKGRSLIRRRWITVRWGIWFFPKRRTFLSLRDSGR